MRPRLPALPVTHENKLWLATFVGLAAMATYATVGAVTMQLSPRTLPFGIVDHFIPLLPWTFWIYATVYLIYAASCVLQRDLYTYQIFIYGYGIANLASSAIFIIVPTTFPRELYSIDHSQQITSCSAQALAWFRTIDHPTNCLPSMHVGCSVLATLPFHGHRPKLFLLFSAWTAGIALTTLSTKQHYFIDVVGGLALGLVSYHLARILLSKETIGNSDVADAEHDETTSPAENATTESATKDVRFPLTHYGKDLRPSRCGRTSG